MRDDPEVLARAAVDELAKLITVLVRQERFSEGSLMGAFGGGLVLGIVRRAGVLIANVRGSVSDDDEQGAIERFDSVEMQVTEEPRRRSA